MCPLPEGENGLPIAEAVRGNEDGGFIVRILDPVELASPDTDIASVLLPLRLPDTLSLHGALVLLGVGHGDADFAVRLLGGDLPGVVSALEDKGIIAARSLGQVRDDEGLEPVVLLSLLGVHSPLREHVGSVAVAGKAVGQDDGEGLVLAVAEPLELSLVDKHGDQDVTSVGGVEV